MKSLKDIEKLLKDTRLPNREMSQTRHEVWQRIMKTRKEHHKRSPLFKIKPWIWALASILLLLICILFMILMNRY